MKIIFAGPTLHGLVSDGLISSFPGIMCRPPAGQGDIARAVADGATVIGLVDGRYEDVAAPWHKEILYALSLGVAVYGGGSLGALRAVECERFGMIGVGAVFRAYQSKQLVDDSDLAQLHAPNEFGCFPVTEALVNVIATIENAGRTGDLTGLQCLQLTQIARSIFFKDLTLERLADLGTDVGCDARVIADILARNRIDQKRADALLLLEEMAKVPDRREASERGWKFNTSVAWRKYVTPIIAPPDRDPSVNAPPSPNQGH